MKISKLSFADLAYFFSTFLASQPELTCSKSTIKTVGHIVKSVQSKQYILTFTETSFQLGFL